MVLEISIILIYLAYIFITDFKMGLPMVVVIGQFIEQGLKRRQIIN